MRVCLLCWPFLFILAFAAIVKIFLAWLFVRCESRQINVNKYFGLSSRSSLKNHFDEFYANNFCLPLTLSPLASCAVEARHLANLALKLILFKYVAHAFRFLCVCVCMCGKLKNMLRPWQLQFQVHFICHCVLNA